MRNASALQPMKSIILPGLALLLSLTSTTLAQENQELGRMWTFENPPLAYLEKEYGFKPDQEWLNSLRLGSLRLGGKDVLSGFGSASFVLPKGLIMTNTRCVRDAVAATRPGDLDMYYPSRSQSRRAQCIGNTNVPRACPSTTCISIRTASPRCSSF